MKNSMILPTILCVFMLFSGCDVNESSDKGDGNLSMQLRLWNNYEASSEKSVFESSSSPIRLPFVDVVGYKYEMMVTTDVIQEGMQETDVSWITIYESDELKGDTERDFQFTLPAGEYKGFALWQGNDFFWVGDYNGTQIRIPTSNGAGEDRLFNAFGTDGLYILNGSGGFVKVDNNEQIGASFIIEEGKTTTVTIRTNFTAIDWYDNDDSGTWSDGDTADDPIVPDGVNTMADFIVEYE